MNAQELHRVCVLQAATLLEDGCSYQEAVDAVIRTVLEAVAVELDRLHDEADAKEDSAWDDEGDFMKTASFGGMRVGYSAARTLVRSLLPSTDSEAGK